MIVPSKNDNGLLVRFEKLPIAEAERWHAAFVETDGRRDVKSKQAGLNGVDLMTLNEFCDEVEGRISRWLHGRYEVCEAAQILADANPGTVVMPGPDAEVMCRQMEDAIHAGDLTVRLNGVELPATSFTQYRLWKYTVFESDVKEWLKKNPCGYTFNYPYHTPDSDLQAAPVVAESASNSTTPDPERRLARLRELEGNATYKRGEWKITGITALVASEKDEGRKRSDEKTIRADLKEAAENELEAKRANAFTGLGQK